MTAEATLPAGTGQSTNAALSLSGLTISGAVGDIVRQVSLSVRRGETLAVVGESGSGKSLTVRALTGLLPTGLRARGTLQLLGADPLDLGAVTERDWRGIRGNGIALLMQDPFTSLSPLRRVGAQVADTLLAHQRAPGRMSRAEIRSSVLERLAEVRLPERVARQYPHELSGGMRQRVAIAAALAADPAVLIADEPTTALDASTQGETLALINRLRTERGMSVILISHDLELVRGHADAIEVMFGGSVVEQGRAELVLSAPAHPYTKGLLASSPSLDRRDTALPAKPWIETPLSVELPPGSSFGDGYASAESVRSTPPPYQVRLEDGRSVAVYLAGEARPEVVPAEVFAQPAPYAPAAAADASGAALSVAGLRKQFGSHTVLDDVSFAVMPREILGILGESGSGKTTVARCIVGLETWDEGEIHPEPRSLRRRTRGTTPTGGVQIVFQDPASALNPGHTIHTALQESLRVAGDTVTTPAELLANVGLPEHLLRRLPRALSGGQQQRVAIARALALKPDVLICDESVSALDVSVQAQILRLIARLRDEESLSIVFISHDLGVINHIADRVVVLNEGIIVEEGLTSEVLQHPVHPYTARLVAAARATGVRAGAELGDALAQPELFPSVRSTSKEPS
ncbi:MULTISPECIES: ABC transporter ATP-binding protein [unclassified Leucobacter]|uniref:ATP-binding cassette domain-containing protein n=1 Tax=unclassified Leucobacter TaxID=2621730 RepID=UPI00165D9BD9|nr:MULTISPECIES: ABC transporter ATP-binding protein [unclassified Leucobacter]MBC9936015.1 ABC transporter ATP-binding protein [Leucobacter sp. cx-87]